MGSTERKENNVQIIRTTFSPLFTVVCEMENFYHLCSGLIVYESMYSISPVLSFCLLFFLKQQLRKWKDWLQCVQILWYLGLTHLPSEEEANLPLLEGYLSRGNGGRRRVKNLSTLQQVTVAVRLVCQSGTVCSAGLKACKSPPVSTCFKVVEAWLGETSQIQRDL